MTEDENSRRDRQDRRFDPLTKEGVQALAQAFINTNSLLTAKQRVALVTVRAAIRFNQRLEFAKEVAPRVPPRLWPEPITMKTGEDEACIVEASNADLDTAARSIVALLTPPSKMTGHSIFGDAWMTMGRGRMT